MPADLVIVFAYHFPPENVIGALRPFRFCKYLSRQGFKFHVISAADVRQTPQFPGTYIPDPFVNGRRSGIGWQTERLIRRALLPGAVGSQWAVRAYQAALSVVREHSDARITIFSTSPPVATHSAAWLLRRKTGLPWIADCRDPIADNPAIGRMSWITSRTYRFLEKLFVSSAATTIANTDSAQSKLRHSYPSLAKQIELIWNGFDPEERLEPLPPASAERMVLAHIGDLYGGRTATPLLESIRRLVDSGRLNPAAFQVFLAGPAVEKSLPPPEFLERAQREGWFERMPERVPQSSAHHMIRIADALLLIQPQSALQVPGKLFEYLQIGRPILSYVPRNSPVERVLERSGVPYVCAYSSDSDEERDRAILKFFELGRVTVRPNEWFEEQFNARNHAGKVAAMIARANGVPVTDTLDRKHQLENSVL
jgi:hypothetical protein